MLTAVLGSIPGSVPGVHAQPPASVPANPLTAADVALACTDIPLAGTPAVIAEGCVAAARALFGRARLVLPPFPPPLALGDEADGLQPALRFAAIGGDAELWLPTGCTTAAMLGALQVQLERIWSLQRGHAQQSAELAGLRFHLAALQQVTRTLAEVRGAEETERLVLDSVKEVFFAWWAALYRLDEDGRYACRLARTVRDERLPPSLEGTLVRSLFGAYGAPLAPAADDPVRSCFPDDLALLAPLHLGDAGSGLLVLGPRMPGTPYEDQDRALLRALVDASAIALRNADLLEQLRQQAIADPLTGCLNRRGFDERLALEFARTRRYERPLSLVLLDLDRFKQVNDDFGHDIGDHALRKVGQLLMSAFRRTDAACRLGGEEFALIFPETSKADSVQLAERVRHTIEAMPTDERLPRRLTASIGLASYPDDADSLEGLVRAADRALYRAKAHGRNCVVIAGR